MCFFEESDFRSNIEHFSRRGRSGSFFWSFANESLRNTKMNPDFAVPSTEESLWAAIVSSPTSQLGSLSGDRDHSPPISGGSPVFPALGHYGARKVGRAHNGGLLPFRGCGCELVWVVLTKAHEGIRMGLDGSRQYVGLGDTLSKFYAGDSRNNPPSEITLSLFSQDLPRRVEHLD